MAKLDLELEFYKIEKKFEKEKTNFKKIADSFYQEEIDKVKQAKEELDKIKKSYYERTENARNTLSENPNVTVEDAFIFCDDMPKKEKYKLQLSLLKKVQNHEQLVHNNTIADNKTINFLKEINQPSRQVKNKFVLLVYSDDMVKKYALAKEKNKVVNEVSTALEEIYQNSDKYTKENFNTIRKSVDTQFKKFTLNNRSNTNRFAVLFDNMDFQELKKIEIVFKKII